MTSDAEALAQLVTKNKYYWSQFEPLHREEYYSVEAQLKKIVDGLNQQAAKREYSFAIEDAVTGRLIGHISLYNIKRLPYLSGFIGYSVDVDYSGQGIATEAVALLQRFAFEQLHLHRLEAYVAPGNIGSVRVLEKSHMLREGLLRKLLYINGSWVDHYLYAILQEDYKQKKG